MFKKIFFIIIFLYSNITYSRLELINKIVAIVGNDIILENDITKKIQYMEIYEKNFLKKSLFCKRTEALNQLIIDNIIFQSASKMHISVTNNQIDQEINNILKKNKVSKKQLLYLLKNALINYDILYYQIKKEMILNKIFNKVIYQKIFVLPQEIESLYNQFYLRNFNTINLCVNQFFLPKSNFNQKNLREIKLLNRLFPYKGNSFQDKNSLIYKFFISNNFDTKKTCAWKNIKDLPLIFTICVKNIKQGSIIGPVFKKNGIYIFLVKNINWRNTYNNIKFYIQRLFIKDTFIFKDKSEKKIKCIFKKIKMGKISFNDAIENFSDEKEMSAPNKNTRWISIADIDSNVISIIKSLNLNEISYPIHFSGGWNIIKIFDICLENKNLDLIKKKIIPKFLFKKKSYEEIVNWIEAQKKNFYIKIFDNKIRNEKK